MRYLLDTDIFIEMFRANKLVHDQISQLRKDGHVLLYSPVTRAEIFSGLRAGEEMLTAQILSRMACVVIDERIGEKAGRYMQTFRSSHGIQLGDALIAASATETDASLITFNDRHYPMPEMKRHRLQRQ